LALGFSAAVASFGCGKAQEVTLESVGDTMAYNVTSFTVKAGQKVHVLVKSNGSSPATMSHNFVLVKPGTEEAVATAGVAAGEASSYVKQGDANVIAFTGLAKPQQMAEVTFTAPAKGAYPYICTFPGHWQTMKGVMTVTE